MSYIIYFLCYVLYYVLCYVLCYVLYYVLCYVLYYVLCYVLYYVLCYVLGVINRVKPHNKKYYRCCVLLLSVFVVCLEFIKSRLL